MRNTDWFTRYLVLGLCGPLIFLNIWLMGQVFHFFEQVITITALSAILALLLNYPVQWLTQIHIKRPWAIFVVGSLAITLVVMVALALLPLVLNQAIELLEAIPRWLSDSSDQIRMLDDLASSRRWPIDFSQVTNQLQGLIQSLLEWLPQLAIGTLGRILMR
ncbi:MAG: AI-2E family transporter [Acaryochloridaceae cyanobacterium RL_2_7]|nr:AI-2E family transporter [Acaryochloridaceae cyanobacterium RL_2_7]